MLTKKDKKYIEDRIESKIDNLAILIQSGFKQIMATKADAEDVNKRFDKIDHRLDILEYKMIGTHGRRLDKVEDDIRMVKAKFKLK